MKQLTVVLYFTLSTSVFGALTFDGTSTKVAMPADFTDLTGNWTIAFWVRRASDTTVDSLWERWKNSTTERQIAVYLLGNDKVQIDIPYVSAIMTSVGTILAADGWVHVAVTRNGNTWTLYLDGAQDNQVTDASVQESAQTTNPTLGWGPNNNWLDGRMAEVCAWTTALSAPQVASLYSSRCCRYALQVESSSLKGLWPLDDEPSGTAANGDTAGDITPNDENGTCTNGTWSGGILTYARFGSHQRNGKIYCLNGGILNE